MTDVSSYDFERRVSSAVRSQDAVELAKLRSSGPTAASYVDAVTARVARDLIGMRDAVKRLEAAVGDDADRGMVVHHQQSMLLALDAEHDPEIRSARRKIRHAADEARKAAACRSAHPGVLHNQAELVVRAAGLNALDRSKSVRRDTFAQALANVRRARDLLGNDDYPKFMRTTASLYAYLDELDPAWELMLRAFNQVDARDQDRPEYQRVLTDIEQRRRLGKTVERMEQRLEAIARESQRDTLTLLGLLAAVIAFTAGTAGYLGGKSVQPEQITFILTGLTGALLVAFAGFHALITARGRNEYIAAVCVGVVGVACLMYGTL